MSEKYEIKLDGAEWRTSSYSDDHGGQCVQLAALDAGHVGVRDSKNPDGGTQVFTPEEWAAFRRGLEAGEFDDLGHTEA